MIEVKGPFRKGVVPFDTRAGWEDLVARLPKKRKRFGRLPLAAVIALVCLVTTVAAGSFGLHEKLADFFGAGEEQSVLLEEGVSQPKAVMLPGAIDGVKIEILQVVADQAGIYALYEATLPKRIDLPEEVVWEECFLRPTTEGNTGWGVGSDILEIEGNRITGVAYSHALDAPIVPGKVTAAFENLGYWENDAFVTVLEGEWHLFWTLDSIAMGRAFSLDQPIQVKAGQALVTTLTLSPVSVHLEVAGADFEKDALHLEYRDGTRQPIFLGHATAWGWGRDHLADATRVYCMFDAPIDPDQVTAVIIEGNRVPIP